MTLAETLLVIFIIGVLASETIPGIIASHQKKVYYTQYMKAYSTLTGAYSNIVADNGTIVGSYSGSDAAARDLMLNYIKTIKVCSDSGAEGCFVPEHTDLTGEKFSPLAEGQEGFVTIDGVFMLFENYSDDCANGNFDDADGNGIACFDIIFDVNGDKSPNKMGRDIFGVFFTKNGVYDIGAQGSSWSGDKFCDEQDDSRLRNGLGCGIKLIQERAMTY